MDGLKESMGRPDLLASLVAYGERPARRVTRAERWRRRGASTRSIAAAAEMVAGELGNAGLPPGGRCAIHLHDGPLWLAGFFGVLRAGGVAVPLDPSLPVEHLRTTAATLELSAWLCEREVPDLRLEPPRIVLDWSDLDGRRLRSASGSTTMGSLPDSWPSPDPHRSAEIVLTSGTSGSPKAVAVRHGNLRAVLDPLAAEIARFAPILRFMPPLRLAVSLPLSHLYGQVMGVFLPPLLGADTVMVPSLPGADLARILREEKISILATVPRTLTLLGRFLRSAGEDRWGESFNERLSAASSMSWTRRWMMFAPLRRLLGWRMLGVVSGGAAIDPEIETLWRALGYAVIQGYGLTEAAPLVTLNHPLHPVAGSLGKPLKGVEVSIAEDAEILVRGANVALGRGADGRVDTQGWLHTGDLGRKDPEGRLYFLGRKGDRIVTPAGVNIDPEPLVAALRRQPGILDAVILERPWGARGVVSAVLTVRPGANAGEAVEAVNARFSDAARIRSGEGPRSSRGRGSVRPPGAHGGGDRRCGCSALAARSADRRRAHFARSRRAGDADRDRLRADAGRGGVPGRSHPGRAGARSPPTGIDPAGIVSGRHAAAG
jgi:long-chain acyl-CoA synthetase